MELVINLGDLKLGGLHGKALEEKIDLFKTAGFTAMDYGLGELNRDDSPFCGDNYREEAQAIRDICDRKNFPIVQTHAPFKFTHAQWDDPELFESVTFPRMVRSLEISAIFGAKVVVVHPIHHTVYHGHEEEIFERNMEYYGRLIPYCKQFGIKVAVENMFQKDPLRKCIVHDTCSRPEEFIRYVDTLNSEYIVACLDVGHVGLPLSDIDAADFVRALGHNRLQSLHIHDNDYQLDRHILPYLGKMDWEPICRALGEIDYQGDFTYEVSHDLIRDKDAGFVPIGARFMADVGKHLMSMIDANRPK